VFGPVPPYVFLSVVASDPGERVEVDQVIVSHGSRSMLIPSNAQRDTERWPSSRRAHGSSASL
jgi:hypothetical protein